MKTFVLTVSRTFPKTHKRAGQQTFFVEKINEARMPILDEPKEGDWCLFWDNINHNEFSISKFFDKTSEGFWGVESYWQHCQKLSPELSAMIEKEINQIKEK